MEFIVYMILKHLFRIDLSTFPPCIFSRNLHKYIIYNFGIIYRYLVHEQVTNLNIHLFAIYEIHYFFCLIATRISIKLIYPAKKR